MNRLLALPCLWLAACVSASAGGRGAGLGDPSNQNPSQPHPPGEPSTVNSGANVGDAVLMTGIAVGASAAQRASGGCYANCPPGTLCNPGTGLCDEKPCHDRCNPGEYCDVSGPFARCVAQGHEDLKIKKESDAAKTPP